jgi:hypothetical protein
MRLGHPVLYVAYLRQDLGPPFDRLDWTRLLMMLGPEAAKYVA